MNFAASVAEENGLPMTVLPAGDLFYPVRDAGHAPEAMYFAPPQIASKDRPAQSQPMESVYVEGSDALVFFRRLVAELPELIPSVRIVWLIVDPHHLHPVIGLLERHNWRVVLTGWEDAASSQMLEVYPPSPLHALGHEGPRESPTLVNQ